MGRKEISSIQQSKTPSLAKITSLPKVQASITQNEDVCVCVRISGSRPHWGQAIKRVLSLKNLKIRTKWTKLCCCLLALGASDSRQRQ